MSRNVSWWWVGLGLLWVIAVPHALGAPQGLSEMGGGALRWLLRSSEQKELRRAETPQESVDLVERIWKLRDPNPETAENPNKVLFRERVSASDLMYEEDGLTGSLSERGRAHVLLGPPSSLGQRYERSPGLGGDRWRGRPAALTERVLVETWSYRPEDLTPALRSELEKDGWRPALLLRFQVVDGRYRLLEGEGLLRLALRSFLERDGE